ncbi:MAG: hypothetical protein ACO1QB_12060 [Verrucomicrobiales bacterium]
MKITTDFKQIERGIRKFESAFQPEKIERLLDGVAAKTHADMVQATPKKWFGQARSGWKLYNPEPGVRVVQNLTSVMMFLENGTKDHGPKELYGPLQPGQKRKKKSLFIPLTRRAVNASLGGFSEPPVPSQSGKRGILIKKPSGKGFVKLIYGTDYVLAKRVRGIAPRRIIQHGYGRARALLQKEATDLMGQALESAYE